MKKLAPIFFIGLFVGSLTWYGCTHETAIHPRRSSQAVYNPTIGKNEVAVVIDKASVVVKPVVMQVTPKSLAQKLIEHKDYQAVAINFPEFTQLALDLITKAEVQNKDKK